MYAQEECQPAQLPETDIHKQNSFSEIEFLYDNNKMWNTQTI